MAYLYFIALFISFPILKACPEPLTVHIQNYDGPIIVHSATVDALQPCNPQPCNQQPCNPQPCNPQPCNPQPYNHRCNQYETECTCVTKQCGYYQPTGYYPKTSSNGYCSVDDCLKPVVYVVDTDRSGLGCGLTYNKCGNKNCMCGKCGGYY